MDRIIVDEREQFATEWMRRLGAGELGPLAAVQRKPPCGDTFTDVTIEGLRFQGIVFGEHLMVGPVNTGVCNLGVASLNNDAHGPSGIGRVVQGQWYICKYRNQPHMQVALSEAGIRALALEFGLPIVPTLPVRQRVDDRDASYFYASRAFEAICAWAEAHPRKARKLTGDVYLGLWPMAALAMHRIPATPENVALARAAAAGTGAGQRA